MVDRPCLLVFEGSEQALVDFIGVERSYRFEWDKAPPTTQVPP